MNAAIKEFNAGLHVKTAGTTWLEELIGLAEAEGQGLVIAKEIYAKCLAKKDALMAPYRTVIDIDLAQLPSEAEVSAWSGSEFASALRHDPSNAAYNLHFRQLIHVGYKIAAQLGDRYINALKKYEKSVARNVTENLYERHIKRLFL